MNAIKRLIQDDEYWSLRKRWENERTDPFPPFNFDEYLGIEDYKRKLKKALDNK